MEETSWKNLCSGVQSWVTTKAVGNVLGEVSVSESIVPRQSAPTAIPLRGRFRLSSPSVKKSKMSCPLSLVGRTSPRPRSTTSHPSFPIVRHQSGSTAAAAIDGGELGRGGSSAGHNSLDREMQLPACARGTDRPSEPSSARSLAHRLRTAVRGVCSRRRCESPLSLPLPPSLLLTRAAHIPSPLQRSQWRQWRRGRAGSVAENFSRWRQRRRQRASWATRRRRAVA